MTTCTRRRHSVWTTCTCSDCLTERRRMCKLQRNGYYRRTSSDQAWAVLEPLILDAWSVQAIANGAGLPQGSLTRAVAEYRAEGKRTRFGPTIAHAIVTMQPPTAGQVGATVTRRQLRALARIGHGLQTVSTASGVGFSTLAMARRGNVRVSAKIARLVDAAYDRLAMTPGDDDQARNHAAKQGWPAPMAWDDIHDLAAVPIGSTSPDTFDDVVVERILAGDRLDATPAERAEVVRRWLNTGRPLADLERLTGWNGAREKSRVMTEGAA